MNSSNEENKRVDKIRRKSLIFDSKIVTKKMFTERGIKIKIPPCSND